MPPSSLWNHLGASETVLELLGPKLVREPIKSNPGKEFYMGSWGGAESRESGPIPSNFKKVGKEGGAGGTIWSL